MGLIAHRLSFTLHPQLVRDCLILGRFPHCHVLLHRNAAVPWFILVPETTHADFLDLDAPLQTAILRECGLIAGHIRETTACAKINVAAIGNVVPQLHLHVVGRHSADPCWPKPVWGHLTDWRDYPEAEVAEIVARLVRDCGLAPAS
jgi:diadenosine tetraphosphate (Ap4A) HIT family hydrolase